MCRCDVSGDLQLKIGLSGCKPDTSSQPEVCVTSCKQSKTCVRALYYLYFLMFSKTNINAELKRIVFN